MNDERRLIDLKSVESLTGLTGRTIYRLLAEGSFPQPVRISKRAIRWWSNEIDAHLSNLDRAEYSKQ